MATGWPMKTTYANGDVYSASDVNDITGTINLLGSSVAYTAGKNKFINGDFYVNQRNFSSTTTDGTFGFDRWKLSAGGGTVTMSSQNFTAGTAPVSGYEGKTFLRVVTSGQSGTSNYAYVSQRIEDVRTFAGQTVTISFWAKASTGTPKIGVSVEQVVGTGGTGGSTTAVGDITLSSSWARYTKTVAIPSLSGATVGTGSNLIWEIWTSAGTTFSPAYTGIGIQNVTIDMWGFQVEQGSTATAFQTATGTIQGELAACQRYYFRTQTGTGTPYICNTVAGSSTTTYANLIHKVTMRSTPTSVEFSSIKWQAINNSGNITAASISDATPESTLFVCTTTGATAAQMNYVIGQTTSGYMAVNAEL